MGKRNDKVNPQRKRVRFTKEFKFEAIRLLDRGEKPAAQLALELGVARNQLYKWQAQLQTKGEDKAFRGPGAKRLSELSEVEQLRRELKKVTEERDILKKAAVDSTDHCNTAWSLSAGAKNPKVLRGR
jgi:transposase